jgi:periplasmic divalent cation tolerance protein
VTAPTPDVAVVVLSTAPDVDTADRLARAVLEAQLAACVTRVPDVTSLYRWRGEVEEASEVLLVIKTHAERAAALTRMLSELHPYEVPEILVLPVAAGLGAYLGWVREATEVANEGS